MNNGIDSTVKELCRIGALYNRKIEITDEQYALLSEEQEEIESQNEDFIANLSQYQDEQAKKLPKAPTNTAVIQRLLPTPPKNPQNPTLAAIIGIIFDALLALCGVSFLFSFIIPIPISGFCYSMLWGCFLLAIPVGVVWYFHFSDIVEKYLTYKEKIDDWNNTAKTSFVTGQNECFYSECAEFENAFLTLTKNCDAYYETEKEKNNIATNTIRKVFSEKNNELKNQLEDIETQLNAVTLIHPDMFDNAFLISKILETGRADTLKEAINLALEENRKDAEEKERRIEAARQEAILEQQAEETRMHELAMEQAAREHNAAMEREAREHNLAMQAAAQEQNRLVKEQNRLAKEQNDIAQRQNELTEHDRQRCRKCKNRFGCHRDIHNCGSFISER